MKKRSDLERDQNSGEGDKAVAKALSFHSSSASFQTSLRWFSSESSKPGPVLSVFQRTSHWTCSSVQTWRSFSRKLSVGIFSDWSYLTYQSSVLPFNELLIRFSGNSLDELWFSWVHMGIIHIAGIPRYHPTQPGLWGDKQRHDRCFKTQPRPICCKSITPLP